ncbi:hypothetical protein ASPZODRAFT_168135 [Penicilliopsis zonata CBS 506.65]|uniref:Uncharacterized protein n=1 Tax=Penicilliopsis zonata CBS 506.65 TaxID=1073090 RepID=A0A1L9SCZ9_9EURO|nr:hypothetical protein ASPZODRAFT_168135 [Penicilliopsis zonata CBS 506.65]OJJ45039.1 hypothetical protein ASPZODRAFT_168135 [Penicilliopsis zonata CBS 506.65]
MTNSSLGLFARLPPEIRIQIWNEFVPTGEDRYGVWYKKVERYGQRTDLAILRTNRQIYDEITSIIYHHTARLEIRFSCCYAGMKCLAEVHFQRRRQQFEPAVWIFESLTDARDRHFDRFPFHRLKELVVVLYPLNPHPYRVPPENMLALLRRILDIVTLLREGSEIKNLTIRFEKETEGEDWFRQGRFNETVQSIDLGHDAMAMPFCTLRNITDINLEAHCPKLRKEIDWTMINAGIDAVRDRNNSIPREPKEEWEIQDFDVDRQVMENSLWLLYETWYHDRYRRLSPDESGDDSGDESEDTDSGISLPGAHPVDMFFVPSLARHINSDYALDLAKQDPEFIVHHKWSLGIFLRETLPTDLWELQNYMLEPIRKYIGWNGRKDPDFVRTLEDLVDGVQLPKPPEYDEKVYETLNSAMVLDALSLLDDYRTFFQLKREKLRVWDEFEMKLRPDYYFLPENQQNSVDCVLLPRYKAV